MDAYSIVDHLTVDIALFRLTDAVNSRDVDKFHCLVTEIAPATVYGFMRAHYLKRVQDSNFDWMMNTLCMYEGYEEVVCGFWVNHWQSTTNGKNIEG
jgi:hypothetical protein